MALMPLVLAPDERLKQKSALVDKVDDNVRRQLDDMLETMYAARGIGLSGVQVGIMTKIIVIDVDWRESDEDTMERVGNPRYFINAEIVEDSGEHSVYNEGCLSFPDQFAEVERPKTVRVRYLDRNGKQHEDTFDGLLATCLQHEIDHTNGIVFVDHISGMKRDIIMRKMKKAKKLGYYDHDHVHDEHCNH